MMDTLAKLAQLLRPSRLLPVIFVGHGNPMNAIEDNPFSREWERRAIDQSEVQAIVVISAHWTTRGTHVTNAPKQPIIYDFYGFPDELYQVEYKATGSPEIAKLLTQQMLEYEAQLDSSWGLDHGTWSVLKRMAPDPTVPILQISLDVSKTLEQQADIFRSLRPLRRRGVLFIGSGNIVHNLGRINWANNRAFDWAEEFDYLSTAAIGNKQIDLLIRPEKLSTTARLALPTDEHYRPMLAVMSLLEPSESVEFFNSEIVMGSVSMRSFTTV